MAMGYRSLVPCLVLAAVTLGTAQATFKASTDARQLLENGFVEVTFTLSNAQGQAFQPPSFEGFTRVSGPSRSLSTSMFNGQVSRTESYSYTLKPKGVGRYTIGNAQINVGGKILKSNPITIEVLKGREGSGQEEQIFIRAELSTERAYVGQQIILDYKLYTTLNVESFNILQEGNYSGFFAQDVRRFDGRVMREVIGGVQYTTKVLKRIALFPQQTGQLSVSAMSAQLGVAKEGGRQRSFFFSPEVRPVTVATEEVTIDVAPLPGGAPPSFTGAVGQYECSPSLSADQVTTDDAITLLLSVRGDGDVKRVSAPRLDLPDAFEVYDPKVIEETNYELGDAIAGRKVFEYLLLPKEAGTYAFTPSFTYFSPDSARYVTLTTGTYEIEVRPGKGQPRSSSLSTTSGSDIGPLLLDAALSGRRQSPFLGSPLFWGLAIAPFVMLGGLLGWRRMKAKQEQIDPAERRMKEAQRMAKTRLSKAQQHLESGDGRAFYDEVSKALLGYVCDKLQVPRSTLSKDSLRQRLEDLQLDEDFIRQVLQIVKDCELALFAGRAGNEGMAGTYEQAAAVISAMEKRLG